MSIDSGWPLQQAITNALSADATLKTLVSDPVRIFESVPDLTTAAFPFLSIGESTISDEDSSDTDLYEYILTIGVWSQSGGYQQVKQIMAAISDVLHDQSPAVTGHHLVSLRLKEAETFRHDDDQTFRSSLMYRAITSPST